MAVEYTNECCDCAVPGYPCMGSICPNLHVLHIYCDVCGDEDETIYRFNEKDYCKECLVEELLENGVIKKSEDE